MKMFKTKKKNDFIKVFTLPTDKIKKYILLDYTTQVKLSSKQIFYLKDFNVVKNLLKFFAHKFLFNRKCIS